MLILASTLIVVALAYLLVPSGRPRDQVARRMTMAMATLGFATVLRSSALGSRLDRWTVDIASIYVGSTVVELLTTVSMYQFGTIALGVLQRYELIRWWALAMVAVAIAIVATSEPTLPAEAPVTIVDTAHYWSTIAAVAPACALLTVAAVAGLRKGDRDLRKTLTLLAAVGVVGLAYAGTTAVLLVIDTASLDETYGQIVRGYGAPAVALLALAGLVGLRAGRSRR